MKTRNLTVTLDKEQTQEVIGVATLDGKDPETWVRDAVECCLQGALDGSCWRPSPRPPLAHSA